MSIRAVSVSVALLATLTLAGCAPNGEEPVSIFELSAGDCFTPDDENTAAFRQPCAEPHMYEVSEVHPLDGDDYPGDEAVQDLVDEFCPAAFALVTGEVPAASEDYGSMAFTPSFEGWNEQGDRSIVCVVTPLYEDTKSGSAAAVPSEAPTPEGTS